MPPPYRALTPAEFVTGVSRFAWSRRVWRVDLHHTWYPAHADYRGFDSIDRMARFYVHNRGYSDIPQHVTIAPDGKVWTGRDWNLAPVSIGCGMNAGAFMIEMIGNFDRGYDRLEGAQLESTLTVISAVQQYFGLPVHSLLFHREVPQTDKTCPGSSVSKTNMLRQLSRMRHSSGYSEIVAQVA